MRKIKFLLSVMLLIGSCTWIGCSSENSKNSLEVESESLVLYKPLGSYGVYFDNAVAAYQKSYPDVNVQVREFGTNTTDPNVFQQNYNDLKDTLTSELAAGKGPDVVMWTNELDDPYKSMGSGIFDDLNSYISEDLDFDLSEYLETIMDAGVYKNKRYIIPLEYRVPLYMSTEELLEENELPKDLNLSFEEFVYAAAKFADKNNSSPFTSRGIGLSIFFPWSGLNIINYDGFTVNKEIIESEVFRNIMESYRSYYNQDHSELAYSGPTIDAEMLINKNALFTIPGLGEGGYERTLLRGYSFTSHQAEPVINMHRGYDGKVIAEVTTKAAIRANSENKQNAWNFIKILLSSEISGMESNTTNFPVSKQGIEKKISSQIESIEHLVGEPLSGDILGTVLSAESISTEVVEMYRSLITDVDSAVLQNSAVNNILNESMEPYFKSEKSYEDCLENLKNKLELYIGE